MKKHILLLCLLLLAQGVWAQQKAKRIALVIGNAKYAGGAKLDNPENDARLMASTLRDLGFEVTQKTNLNLAQMNQAVAEFVGKIGRYDIALFYYAGHGIQVGGENYLIPIGADFGTESAVPFNTFEIEKVNQAFAQNRENANLMILDACREDPYRSWGRGGNRGFKKINSGLGTLIAFATEEGKAADDGDGSYGVYTQELVKQLKKQQSILDVFNKTREAVAKATNYQQIPEEWNKLMNNFYLKSRFQSGAVTEGSILIDSELAGELYVDGLYYGRIQANTIGNRIDRRIVGEHQIELKTATQTFSRSVQVRANESSRIAFKRTKNRTRLPHEPEMVLVAGGSFTMGCKDGRGIDCLDDEKPAHQVTLSTYYIGKYEVSNEEFCMFLNEKGNQSKGGTEWLELESGSCGIQKSGSKFVSKSGYAKHPVVEVSWYGARAYCKWLSNKTSQNYRLPTEAEWEFAARGGNSSRNYQYSGSDNIEEVAWYGGNSDSDTRPVGKKKANELGIHDMSGNVWEWCEDYWHDNYEGAPSNGRAWTSGGNSNRRVLRGGSWNGYARYCRSSNRDGNLPLNRYYYVGFRLVRA